MKENLRKKQTVVYFHRYPIEYENVQYPGMNDLLRALLKKKYKVIYFSMKGFSIDKKLRKGINFAEIPIKIDTANGFDKLVKTFFYYLRLPFTIYKLKKLNPDFIICKETLPFIPSIVGRLKVPMLIDTSDWWWSIILNNSAPGRKFSKFIEKKEVSDWNRFNAIAVSHTKAEAKLVNKKGMSINKIKVINAPLYPEVYFKCNADKERKKLGFTKKDWVVAVHGVIHPSKGYEQLVKWWGKLAETHPNWRLLIIGGQDKENSIRRKIKQMNLEKNIIMVGWLPTQKHVNKYLNAADCLLITRRNTEENKGVMPSSLYHSFIIGKPTVATGLPGMAEIIEDRKSGYLFKPDSFTSFKSTLEEIYNNPRQASKIAKRGIKRGNKCFNPKMVSKKYLEIIENGLRNVKKG